MSAAPAPAATPLTYRAAVATLGALRLHRHDDYLEVSTYRRGAFGPAWWDAAHVGLSTRDAVLAEQLTATQYVGPRLVSGMLDDPYTGERVRYSRAWRDVDLDEVMGDALVVVDHVVSLWEAWTAGAWAWPHDKRLDFANDPRNLLATTWTTNQRKGALSASEWHPHDRQRAADFARRIVTVKAAYGLEVTGADTLWLRRALRRDRS